MKNAPLSAQQGYDAAYQAQYSDDDALEALRLYASVISDHPEAKQARDARSQIRNITCGLTSVPDQVHADISLALSHFASEVPAWFTRMLEAHAVSLNEAAK